MTDRDKRAIENMTRTGMNFDDLQKAFLEYAIEEVEQIYMRVRSDTVSDKPDAVIKG